MIRFKIFLAIFLFLSCLLAAVLFIVIRNESTSAMAASTPKKVTTVKFYSVEEACKYDLFDGPVLAEDVFSPNLEESIAFTRANEFGKHENALNFHCEFDDRYSFVAYAKFLANFQPDVVAKSHPGNAAAIATLAYLAQQGSIRPLPVVITAHKESNGYDVDLKNLPQHIGSETFVKISKDFKTFKLESSR